MKRITLKPIKLSQHRHSLSSIKIDSKYHNVQKLIIKSPLLLWDALSYPNKKTSSIISKVDFIRLKEIIKARFPEVYKEHVSLYKKKLLNKMLLNDLISGKVNSGTSRFKRL